jgi:CBS domain-containing protein/ribosome-associated translation inhibitor RaiA
LSKYIEELRRQPAEAFLSELMEVPSGSSLTKIVGLLRERGVYEVFLPEGTRSGMISARDILKITNIDGPKPSAIMTYVPVLRKESLIGEVGRLMTDYRNRAVPISDGRKVVGQVNSSTILGSLKGRIGGEMRVTSIATKSPTTIDREAPIAKARDLMVRKRIDHVPVTSNQRLDGIIRSIDILSHIAPPERVGSKSRRPETRGSLDFPVGDAMEGSPLACSADTTVERALDLMLSGGKSYVLVTQWEELQGIATHRDFMTLVAEPEPESEVPVFMVGLPDDPFEAEATKAKFKRTVGQLRRVFPDILEARSVIKSKVTKPGKERRRYEVNVQIRTTRNSYTYSDEGWELPTIYDAITDRLKRLLTQKRKPRRSRERETQEQL